MRRELRSAREIALMRQAGLVVWQAHQTAFRLIRPGVTTSEIDAAIAHVFARYDAQPLFLDYPGTNTPFPAVTCISVNEELVHGIPNKRPLREGDIVSIDTGCRLNGWCGDAAITHPVGPIDATSRRLLDVTLGTLNLAIELMKSKTRWSDVAREMGQFVWDAGFSVVEDMVGHGIGREMHEPPNVPNYYDHKWAKKHDFDLRPGVVLAIEPMVNVGVKELKCLDDHWTLVTVDGKRSAHFEHTVAVTNDGPRRLTGPPSDDELASLPVEFHDPSSWVRW